MFDPFMYLSLPLPIEKTRWLTVHLVRLDPAAIVEKVGIHVHICGVVGADQSCVLGLRK